MRRAALVVAMSLLLSVRADADERWLVRYGGPDVDIGRAVTPMHDGGYVVVGDTLSFGVGGGLTSGWALRVDPLGEVIWQVTLAVSGRDATFAAVTPALDGGVFITGALIAPSNSLWIVRLNGGGSIAFDRQYTITTASAGAAVIAMADGGCVVAGMINGQSGAMRVDSTGTPVWTTTFGGAGVTGLAPTSDGGFMLIGTRSNVAEGRANDFQITRLAADGTMTFQTMFGGTADDFGTAICPAPGGFVVAGITRSFGSVGDMWAVRIDENATPIWGRAIGGPIVTTEDAAAGIAALPTGGFALAGRFESDVAAARLDDTGALLEYTTFPAGAIPPGDALTAIAPTMDGGLVAAGHIQDPLQGTDLLVMRLDASLALGFDCITQAPLAGAMATDAPPLVSPVTVPATMTSIATGLTSSFINLSFAASQTCNAFAAGTAALDVATSDAPVADAVTMLAGDDSVDVLGGIHRGMAMGDFNGDGLDDLALGAYGADRPDGTPNAGELDILFGAPGLAGRLVADLNTDRGPVPGMLRILGDGALDEFGFSVAAGDLNGDGLDDLVVGAWRRPFQGNTFGGKGYIFFGERTLPSGAVLDIRDPGARADVEILPAAFRGFLGLIAATGDLDDDGFDDVVITAPFTDRDETTLDTGDAFILWGGATMEATIDLAVPPAQDGTGRFNYTRIRGFEAGALVGHGADTGDFDGDGIMDLALGAPGITGVDPTVGGRLYILAGGSTFPLLAEVDLDPGFFPNIPWAVWLNDGIPDAALGALVSTTRFDPNIAADHLALSLTTDESAANSSAVMLFILQPGALGGGGSVVDGGRGGGRGGVPVYSLSNLGSPAGAQEGLFMMHNTDPAGGLFGRGLAFGSSDGDAHGELFAGSPDNIPGAGSPPQPRADGARANGLRANEPGEGFLLRANAAMTPPSGNFNASETTSLVHAFGGAAGERLPGSAAIGGDLNGDGFGEFVFSSPGFDNPSIPDLPPPAANPRDNNAGGVFIVWGRPTAENPTPSGRARATIPFFQEKHVDFGAELPLILDFPANGQAGQDTVRAIYERGATVPPLLGVTLPVTWHIVSARIGFGCVARFGYHAGDVAMLEETQLQVFERQPDGTWSGIDSIVDTARREVVANIGSQIGLYALSAPPRQVGAAGLMVP